MKKIKPENGWKKLFDEYEEVRETFYRDERKKASGFSIFEVLDIERLERETHSAFLANLLDPYGSHGQGTLFLVQFMKYVKKKIEARNESKGEEIKAIEYLIKAANSDTEFTRDWLVATEKHVAIGDNLGRLDIVIQHVKTKNTIIIENKIDSNDREDQLKKYSKWRDDLQRREKCVGILLYLTLDGSDSKISKPIKYHCLSYKADIRNWLIDSMRGCLAPRIKNILDQYLATMGKLTGELNMTEDKLTNFLGKNSKYLRLSLEIADAAEELKRKIESEFWKSIKEGLEKKLKGDAIGKNWEAWMTDESKINENWYGVGIYQSFASESDPVFWIACWRWKQDCYFGIRTPEGRKIPANKNKENLLVKLKTMGFDSSQDTKWVLGCAKLPGLQNSKMDINSLVKINEDREPLVREVVDAMWKLFEEIRKHVVALNKEMPQKVRRKVVNSDLP